jgi:chromate transporter
VILGFGLAGLLASLALARAGRSRRRRAGLAEPASLAALVPLTLVMLKSGAFVFGTGLAIVPLLVHDVVDRHHWLTHHQFMDALALGQVTPGPVVITATFIGYKVAGLLGAVIATICIFAPSFFNMLTWFPWAERKLGGTPHTKGFVLCAVAAVAGAIATTVVRLALAPIDGGSAAVTAAIAVAALVVMLLTRTPVWAIIPLGGALSALWSALS